MSGDKREKAARWGGLLSAMKPGSGAPAAAQRDRYWRESSDPATGVGAARYVMSIVDDLTERGLLERTGQGRGTRYRLVG